VWAFPYDPALDGVEDAATAATVTEAIGTVRGRLAAVSVEPVRYRPLRRAVFRYRSLHLSRRGRRWETSFGKVVPSEKARRIEAATGVLRAVGRRIPLALPAGPLGRDGLLFPALRGRSLRQLLVSGSSLPSPTRIAALPGGMVVAEEAEDLESLGPRPTPAALAGPAADLVARLVPDVAPAAERLRAEIQMLAQRDHVPPSVVHGDLYEAQIFVGDGFELGLIDLDDVGRGDPVLDAANFCAHLLALALAVPSASDRLVAYRSLIRPAFTHELDVPPRAIAWREALCMLLLAAGPFRVLDPAWPAEIRRRVALAVRLLEET
jgi:Ser/Thr protein kinase RdoA (MazF antagonist)